MSEVIKCPEFLSNTSTCRYSGETDITTSTYANSSSHWLTGASDEEIHRAHKAMMYTVVDWRSARHALRAITLPIRVGGTFIKKQLSPTPNRKLSSWTRSYEAVISSMRSILKNAPRDPKFTRPLSDISVYQIALPDGCFRFKTAVERISLPGEESQPSSPSSIEIVWATEHTPSLSKSTHLGSAKVMRQVDVLNNEEFLRMINNPRIPVVYYFHGGAYIFCKPGLYRPMHFRMALKGMVIISLDFIRPPEVTIPDVTKEAVAGFVWLTKHLGILPERICMMGDSAGGNLVLNSCILLNSLKLPRPGSAILVSPWVDLSTSMADLLGESENAKYDYLPPELVPVYARMAAGPEISLEDPAVSPALAGPLLAQAIPRNVLISFGEYELLRPQQERLADFLKDKCDLSVEMLADQVHVPHILVGLKAPGTGESLARMTDFILEHCSLPRLTDRSENCNIIHL